jgi:N-acetylglutamate synthase-like GNAT family acetyltransferase
MIRALEESDAEFCNSLWIYKNDQSLIWVRSLILLHGGYAVVDQESNEILSCAIYNDHIGIGLLNTIEKARRKGYGEILVKYFSQKIAERGLIPTTFINNSNTASITLFTKLGFKKIQGINWIST